MYITATMIANTWNINPTANLVFSFVRDGSSVGPMSLFRSSNRELSPDDPMGLVDPGGDAELPDQPSGALIPYTVATQKDDDFNGSWMMMRLKVVDELLLFRAIYQQPVLVFDQSVCDPDPITDDNLNHVAIPLPTLSSTVRSDTEGDILSYALYVDVPRYVSQNNSGCVFSVRSHELPASVVVGYDDRVGTGDTVFITDVNERIFLFEVTRVDPDDGGFRTVGLTPLPSMCDCVDPTQVEYVGWVDTVNTTTDAEVQAAVNEIVTEYRKMQGPAPFYMAGVCGEIQPRQYDAWKNMVNVTVLMSGQVSLILDQHCRPDSWCPGDGVEMQLGVPRSYADRRPDTAKCVRLEVRYTSVGNTVVPDHWTSITWRRPLGHFITSLCNPYYYSCSLAYAAPALTGSVPI
jgi:hypothetical protein